MHLIERIGSVADPDTKMRLGCTCRELRHFITNGKVSHFIKQKKMLKEYGIIRDFVELENVAECENSVSNACISTMGTLYFKHEPSPKYREVDPELYNVVVDELRLDCPDFVLIYAFWRKVERRGLI